MLTYIAFGTLIALAVGLATKFVLAHRGDRSVQISGLELVIGTLLCALVVAPSVTAIGFSISKASAVTYNEWWGGLEESADARTVTCTKDGSCTHTYDCDSYVVKVRKTRTVSDGTESYTDANGKRQTRTKYKTETYYVDETRYHQCPYVTSETTFTLTDTLGETYTFGSHWFPENPEQHRWTGFGHNDPRFGFGAPGLPNVSSGKPPKWVAAKARIDSGNPGGTTARKTYKNYILAASDDIYAKASDAIDTYVKAGQMPKPVKDVRDLYLADKVYYVGPVPDGTDKDEWLAALMRLNGHLGGDRQGDLHLVLVTDPAITNPDEYSQALAAYWQSEALGKDTFSKNGVGLVVGVGTDGTIAWSRGFTGMPEGNEALAVSLRNDLAGKPATPASLLDDGGLVRDLLLAEDAGFVRVNMADYDYLYDQIEPGPVAKTLVLLVGLLIAIGIWTGFAFAQFRFPQRWTDSIRHARLTGQPLTRTSDHADESDDRFDPSDPLARYRRQHDRDNDWGDFPSRY